MGKNENSLISEFRLVAQNVLPKGSQVWLYGSRARGDSHEESDWDLLILIDKQNISTDDEDKYSFPFVMKGWQHSTAVSPLLYTYKDWRKRKASTFYANVERDKVIIA